MKNLKLILLSISIVVGTCITSVCIAQEPTTNQKIESLKNSVRANFKVYLDGKLTETDQVEFSIVRKDKTINVTHKMPENFTAFLDYNSQYSYKIGHKGFNTKSIIIDTHAPNSDWYLECKVYLYSDEKDQDIGRLAYNKNTGRFKLYENKN